jgi:septal ring factor EnvC (AmiA/AmiB activator)
VQEARSALSQAMSDRTDLPKRLTDDPDRLAALQAGAKTLSDFAKGLAPDDALAPGFEAAQGALAWPALGQVILTANETDARGVTRPGISLATRPLGLVTAPWAATVRYRGPLLDYGNVMILEPGEGYLLILAGLEKVYGEVGDVVSRGDAVGLMGGAEGTAADILSPGGSSAGASDSETLYVELRKDGKPIDPMAWFVPEGE